MSADYRTLHNLYQFAIQHFQYVADIINFGESDHWCGPDEIRGQLSAHGCLLGDCDDFASLAVMLARQQGMPARFVMCLTEDCESHLVAEVDGWVLDNRHPDVMRRDDLPYTWLAISGFAAGDPWHVIQGDEGGEYA